MGKTFSFVSGALFGAAAGAIIGVALAPRSGAETRAMAADIANDAWDNMRDTYEHSAEEARAAVNDFGPMVDAKTDDLRAKVDLARERMDQLREQLNDAISGGNVTPAADVVVENVTEAGTEATESSTEADCAQGILSASRFIVSLPKTSAPKRKLGKIHFPVFTPGGTRVVGFMVRQSDIAGMIERPDRFVALDAIGVYEGAVAVDDVRGTYDAAAAKRLDINLDDCIIWVGMDVRTESGDVVGYCSDVEFKPRSGIVQTFYVTASAASSMLVGDTQVPPTMLRGYENGAMIVSDEVKALGYSGGAAAKAAEASVVVGDKVKKGAKVLDDKGSVAVDKGSRALGKQLGKTRGMFKAYKDEYQKASGGSSKASK